MRYHSQGLLEAYPTGSTDMSTYHDRRGKNGIIAEKAIGFDCTRPAEKKENSMLNCANTFQDMQSSPLGLTAFNRLFITYGLGITLGILTFSFEICKFAM